MRTHVPAPAHLLTDCAAPGTDCPPAAAGGPVLAEGPWLLLSTEAQAGPEEEYGRILAVGARAEQLLESPAESLRGARFTGLVTYDSRPIARILLREGTGRQPLEFLLPGGDVVCMTSCTTRDDGTLLVRLEEDVPCDHWESLRQVARLSRESLWMYEEAADRLSWLDGAAPYFDLRPGHGVGLDELFRRVHPDDRERLAEVFWQLRRGEREIVDVDYRLADDNGGYRWLRTLSRLVTFGFGSTRRVIGTTMDNTAIVQRHQDLALEVASESQRRRVISVLASALVTATTEDELSRAVLAQVAPAFTGTATLLAFVDDGRLHITAGEGIDPALVQSLNGLSLAAPKPLTEAIRTGRTTHIASRADYRAGWPQADRLLRATGAESFVMVPFASADGEPLGAWMIAFAEQHHLDSGELTLLETLAGLAGQTLERIRIQTARVELANALQQTMLPQVLPEVAGVQIQTRYQPAHTGLDVGGDWFDVISLPDGSTAFVIGDVQGHNVTAAALMGQIRTAIRAYALADWAPGDVLTRTNALLTEMGTMSFATCLYVRMAPDGELRAARAGHTPMVLVRHDGTTTICEDAVGPPLGVPYDGGCPESVHRLGPGDLLALVTDGVVEGPQLPVDTGLAQLADTLAANSASSLRELADLAIAGARATGHHDDVAVLLARRLPTAPEA
ncbi:SpoIIE family protein phosphatase [Streptomyces sp. T-3]|nr:SpoIIE family protein phosphatase [Streptomyces sp. T-3]